MAGWDPLDEWRAAGSSYPTRAQRCALQRPVRVLLSGGEHQPRDPVGVGQRPYGLDVDSDVASFRDGERGKRAAMGQVEPQVRVAEPCREARFAGRAIREFDRAGRYPQPSADQLPQPRSGHDEPAAGVIAGEPGGPASLVVRQQHHRCPDRSGPGIQ
jgi:hypothetical protein